MAFLVGKPTMYEIIHRFLSKKGQRGATLAEIYAEVRCQLGADVPDSSVRSVLYKRLPGAKGKYRSRFTRLSTPGGNRYRLL